MLQDHTIINQLVQKSLKQQGMSPKMLVPYVIWQKLSVYTLHLNYIWQLTQNKVNFQSLIRKENIEIKDLSFLLNKEDQTLSIEDLHQISMELLNVISHELTTFSHNFCLSGIADYEERLKENNLYEQKKIFLSRQELANNCCKDLLDSKIVEEKTLLSHFNLIQEGFWQQELSILLKVEELSNIFLEQGSKSFTYKPQQVEILLEIIISLNKVFFADVENQEILKLLVPFYCHRVESFPKRTLSPLIITIGGTNGKGTSVRLLQRLLSKSYPDAKILALVSPHIVDYNERYLYNELFLEKEVLELALLLTDHCQKQFNSLLYKFLDFLVTRIKISSNKKDVAAVDNLIDIVSYKHKSLVELNFSQFNTLSANFAAHLLGVDIFIQEVGIGGIFDATNAIDAHLSMITSIGKDHCELLGTTEEEILSNKLGITRTNNLTLVAVSDYILPLEFQEYRNNFILGNTLINLISEEIKLVVKDKIINSESLTQYQYSSKQLLDVVNLYKQKMNESKVVGLELEDDNLVNYLFPIPLVSLAAVYSAYLCLTFQLTKFILAKMTKLQSSNLQFREKTREIGSSLVKEGSCSWQQETAALQIMLQFLQQDKIFCNSPWSGNLDASLRNSFSFKYALQTYKQRFIGSLQDKVDLYSIEQLTDKFCLNLLSEYKKELKMLIGEDFELLCSINVPGVWQTISNFGKYKLQAILQKGNEFKNKITELQAWLQTVTCLVDVAHNTPALDYTIQKVNLSLEPDIWQPVYYIVSFGKNKDFVANLRTFIKAKNIQKLILVPIIHEQRGVSLEELQQAMQLAITEDPQLASLPYCFAYSFEEAYTQIYLHEEFNTLEFKITTAKRKTEANTNDLNINEPTYNYIQDRSLIILVGSFYLLCNYYQWLNVNSTDFTRYHLPYSRFKK